MERMTASRVPLFMTPNCRRRVAAVYIVGYDLEAAYDTVRTTEYEISIHDMEVIR
jgi:hypothetical protein